MRSANQQLKRSDWTHWINKTLRLFPSLLRRHCSCLHRMPTQFLKANNIYPGLAKIVRSRNMYCSIDITMESIWAFVLRSCYYILQCSILPTVFNFSWIEKNAQYSLQTVTFFLNDPVSIIQWNLIFSFIARCIAKLCQTNVTSYVDIAQKKAPKYQTSSITL